VSNTRFPGLQIQLFETGGRYSIFPERIRSKEEIQPELASVPEPSNRDRQ
jgi:hypothetical protein